MVRHITKHDSTKGFTLIEVLAVVIIIGILFGIAAPGWVTFANNRRVGSSQDQVVLAIRKAQTEALRKRREQRVRFNTAADPPTLTVEGEIESLGYGAYRPGRRIVTLTTPVPELIFNASGALEEERHANQLPIVITVTAPTTNSRRCVVVQTLLGAVRKASPGEPGCP